MVSCRQVTGAQRGARRDLVGFLLALRLLRPEHVTISQACLTGGGGCATTSKGPEAACACCGTTFSSRTIGAQAEISVKLGTNFTTHLCRVA